MLLSKRGRKKQQISDVPEGEKRQIREAVLGVRYINADYIRGIGVGSPSLIIYPSVSVTLYQLFQLPLFDLI